MSDSEIDEFESADEDSKSSTGEPDVSEATAMVHCNLTSRTMQHTPRENFGDSVNSGAIQTHPSSYCLSENICGPLIAELSNRPEVASVDEKDTHFPLSTSAPPPNVLSNAAPPSSFETPNSPPNVGDVSPIPTAISDQASTVALDTHNDRPEQYDLHPTDWSVELHDKSADQSNVCDPVCGADEGWEVESLPDIPADDKPERESELDFQYDPCSKDRELPVERRASSIPFDSFEPYTDDRRTEEEHNTGWNWSAVSSFAQQFTTSFQTKGLTLVHEGVNVLEMIGKKTMSVLEETDPGFKYTKQLLRPPGIYNRPNLSQVVREAYERQLASDQSEDGVGKGVSSRDTFAAQLESSRGLVHLEALELISDQAESQLHILLSKAVHNWALHNDLLESVWTVLQLDSEEKFENSCGLQSDIKPDMLGDKDISSADRCLHPSNLPREHILLWSTFQKSLDKLKWIYPTEHLVRVVTDIWNGIEYTRTDLETQSVFQSAITALTRATTADLEYLHKMSECVLVQNQEQQTDFVYLASTAASVIRTSILLKNAMCDVYIKIIKSPHRTADDDSCPESPTLKTSSNQLVASLMLECNNAEDYMKNAARLLVPVFQLAYVKSCLTD